MFTNPFYAGYILWGGQLFQGKHEPVVTKSEFEHVQNLLGRPRQEKRQGHTFSYRGMIRCGACGLQLTAEHKVNRYGTQYIYYHCTRIHRTPRCTEPSVEARDLDRQLRSALECILVPDAIHQWALRQLAAVKNDSAEVHKLHVEKLQRSISDTERHLSNLTDLRVRGLIDDAEFLTRRQTLQRELYRLQENVRSQQYPSDEFEPEKALLLFSNRAIIWFDRGDDDTKRKILEIVSSNPTVRHKKLNVEAKKPFLATTNLATSTRLRAERSGVRTLCHRGKNTFLADFRQCVRDYSAENPEALNSAVANIKELAQKIDGHFPAERPEDWSSTGLSSAA